MPRSVADALQDSTSAVALLASSIEVSKGEVIDYAAEAKAAGVLVEGHVKLAGEFEKTAVENRTAGEKASNNGVAGPLLTKAAESDLLVVHHLGLAKGYADLIAHYAVAGSLGKALVPEVKIASAEDHTKSAAFHTEAAKKATEAKDDNTAKHHTAIAEAYTALSKAASPTAEQASPGQGPGNGTEGDGNEGDADDARKEKKVDDGSDGVDGKTKPGETAYDASKGAMGEKCGKCGSTMGKGTDKCANCGASMTKVDLDAGGIVTILKGALENTKDDALKSVITTALGSLSGGDDAAKAAEVEKKAKEAEAAKQAEITTKIAALTTDCADAVKALDTMTNAVKGMAKDVLTLQKQVKGQVGVIDTLRGQVTKLESQPEASRARGSAMATLRKSDDGGGSDDARDDFTKRLLAVPAGRERADFLVRQGYTNTKR